MVVVLGVECTAHTFGIGIVKDGKVLANIKDSYVTKKGGMIPIAVRKHHKDVSNKIYKEALEKAKIKEEHIDAVAVSNAPGLAPCLLEGMDFAKNLAKKLKVPIVCVNHCIAHLEIGDIFGAKDPVMLYASGANTQIISYEAGKYRIFGETLDLGVGNFIDGFARFVGLGFPGGPKIQELAKKGKKLIELSYSIKGMDVSFSGMQTKLKTLYNKKEKLEDLSFSLQEYAFAMLVEAAERAIAHTDKKELLLGGGVSCNERLKEMCEIMCKDRGIKFICPSNEYLVDNGAMIAYLGWKKFRRGIFSKNIKTIDISPRERTDDIDVDWK